MAELNTNAANDLCTQLVMLLTKYGMNLEEAKVELYGILHDYTIERRSTEMVVYEGNINTDILKKFLAVKMVKGCSAKTIKMYRQSIELFMMTVQKPVTKLTVDDVRWYIARRMKTGVSTVTVNNELRAMSSLCTWMQDEEIITSNPVIKNGKIKTPKVTKKAFTEEEIERMRVGLRTWREKAIFEMLLSTGCRVSELVGIRIKDLQNDGSINILGKGNKYRIVYVNARAQLAINSYLAERKDDNPWLFARMKDKIMTLKSSKPKNLPTWYADPELVDPQEPMGSGTVEMIVRHLGRSCGVENVHPHRFRRTCATYALRRGMSLELVSKMLGHENVGTTQIYLDLNEEDLKMAHRRYVM